VSDDPSGRRFSDREVALILNAAAELQEREGAGTSIGRLSIRDIEQIAAEVGMDAALVRRAVQAVDGRGSHARTDRLRGGPQALVVERTVEGEMGPATAEAVPEAVRGLTGEVGEASTVGRLFGWRGRLDGARTEVSVAPDGGRTRMRVRVALDEVATSSYAGRGVERVAHHSAGGTSARSSGTFGWWPDVNRRRGGAR
jgi:hypothetical protein